MKLPNELYEIFQRYYKLQMSSESGLTVEQQERFVKELICTYNSLPRDLKQDVLIPAESQFLTNHFPIFSDSIASMEQEFEVDYIRPDNDGFAGNCEAIELQNGELYDRIGSCMGRYVAPFVDGKPQSFKSRAIPYYIPEMDIRDNPAYHVYRVHMTHKSKPVKAKRGKVAPAYKPDYGNGTQVLLPKRICVLGDVLKDETK